MPGFVLCEESRTRWNGLRINSSLNSQNARSKNDRATQLSRNDDADHRVSERTQFWNTGSILRLAEIAACPSPIPARSSQIGNRQNILTTNASTSPRFKTTLDHPCLHSYHTPHDPQQH